MASIQKRPDGAWRARYRDRSGKEHARHFRRKVDAQRWLDESASELVTGLWADPQLARGKLETQAAAWLASHPEWAPSTRARNRSIVGLHILPRWGGVRLGQITTEDVQKWVGELTVSAGSIRKITGVLSGIMEQAVATKYLAVNPVAAVARPKQPMKRRRYLNAIEVERLANCAGVHSDMILTLAYCGLRFGEMAALHVSSVDTQRRRFMIEQSVTEVNGVLEWSAPKDHQRRSVPYPDFLADPIAARVNGHHGDRLVFPTPGGHAMRIGNARRDWFDPAVQAANLSPLTPHELRHTAASLAVAAGASVLALQRMLGHDKPSTTLDVYADLFDEDLDRLAERLATARSEALADFLRTNDSPNNPQT
ncbi:tyrosine-type recombinase/integrase [Propionibacterium freudenreichii]|uniref:tyrosine-type recombinase/integrase n=1 Tax=Propionibacterium freudenreichii TaxID=1744 RepID=UPI002A1E2284|nr:tyrosine-type recombinase/integrase [Propionibacterium freudenreichii]